MTEPRSIRAFPADLEVRGGDGRTLHGILAPFDVATPIIDPSYGRFMETIAPGAFQRTIAERGPGRVKVMSQHDYKSLPVGKATSLREDPVGLVGDLRISSTARGDEVIELVRDGSLDGLSIGFRSILDDWKGANRTLLEIRLDEVSVVAMPAYDTARILAVRSAYPTPLLDLAHKRLELLRKH